MSAHQLERQVQDHVLRLAMHYAESENVSPAMDAIERGVEALRIERAKVDAAEALRDREGEA